MLEIISPNLAKTTEQVTYKDIVVPKDYLTDGASIPRFLWSVFGHPFSYRFQKAAIIHDYLYETHERSRQISDQYFYELLLERNVSKFKAWSMWLGVRMGGHFSY